MCALLLGLVIGGDSYGATKELTILWTSPFQAKVINRMAAEYSEAFNVDVKVDVVSWEDVVPKVSALKAAGTPPDLGYIISGQGWTFYQNGWLNPLTKVVAFLGGDDYFMPSPGYQKVEGEYWLIPVGTMPLKITYRRDLFKQKGLGEPKTWDDILKAAKTLTEDLDGDGKVDRYGISFCASRTYCLAVWFTSVLWANGGYVLDEGGNVVFDSPQTVEALKFMKELAQYAPPGIAEYSWENNVDTYAADKAAMTEYSELRVIKVADERNPAIARASDVAEIPVGPSGQASRNRWTTMHWMNFKGSKNSEEAKRFVEWFMQPARLINYYHGVAEAGSISAPAEKLVLQSEKLWEHPLYQNFGSVVKKYSTFSQNSINPVIEHPGKIAPAVPVFMQDMTITDAVQEVLYGGASPEAAASKAAKKMKKYMKKHK
jgi:multiple sugar transport system substrate-binding protein